MRNPVLHSKTEFSMRRETLGQWAGKWIIETDKSTRPHMIIDTETEADMVMEGIKAEAAAWNDMVAALHAVCEETA